MDEQLLSKNSFLRDVFEAIPAMLFIVDDDVRMLHLNATASNSLGLDIKNVYKKRGGEALHCIHSREDPEGCGRAFVCKGCVVRNAVVEAASGGKMYRKATIAELVTEEGIKSDIHLLVTASPLACEGKTFVLLALENVSELIRLKSLLPICMHCKKIRDDEGYWNDVTSYFKSQLDVDFSHGLCTECLDKYYPEA